MRITGPLITLIASLSLVACSGIETHPAATEEFASGNYQYFTWRSEPLKNTANSSDMLYLLDPLLREHVNADLVDKGFVLDADRAQFSVDYFYATGMREGQESEAASNITPYPRILPNRQVDGATVDNAHALGGVKQTSNVVLQFNDVVRSEEVWHVIVTKIVEDANTSDREALDKIVRKAVHKALQSLPKAD